MKNKFTPERQAAFVDEVMTSWAREVDGILRQQLRAAVGNVPEETIRLLRYQVLKKSGNLASDYMLSFQDSGRIVDMRRIEYRNRPWTPDENFILDWVKKKGLNEFRKGIPGYRGGTAPNLTDDQKAARIAGAIIASKGRNMKSRKRRRRRGRKWSYNKTIYKEIQNLIRRLIREQADWLADNMGRDLERNLSAKIQL